MNELLDIKELEGLSEQEKNEVLKILKEYSTQGKSESYNELLYEAFEERPADVETFLKDPKYLGRGLIDDSGRFTVFPYWVETMKKIFPNNIDTAYNTLILTGSIGIGKTLFGTLCILYELHRLLCLKDPYLYYGLQPIDKISISLLNAVSKEAAKGVAWDKLQQLIQTSEWFMSHGELKGRTNVEYVPNKKIELIAGSRNSHVIGRAIFSSMEDEINFSSVTADVEKIKQKALKLITQVDARMQSRFMKGEILPTLNIIISSKDSEQSFLETYIKTKKENNSKTTLIIDEPQWVIRTDKDSKEKFYVAVGNRFLPSELLPYPASEEIKDEYIRKGYTLLKVPIGYQEAFQTNIDLALTDIAGISTSSSMKYISGARWNEIKNKNYKNPFTKDVIEVGDNIEDTAQYSDFFDLSRVPKNMLQKPLFIHLDMSTSGDKTGIAGVWIKGKKPTIEGVESSKELFYMVAFSVSIKAPKGHQISFEKHRTFIRWLKEQGFKIKGISSDTFQSVPVLQQLTTDGFNTKIISVDRVEPESKTCLPYQAFKSSIYERRLEIYDICPLATEEVVGLERLSNGKIEHPNAGKSGCFTADTKVRLVDGRSLSFIELIKEYDEGKTNYIYSINLQTRKIETKKILKAWLTLKNQQLIRVTLKNGEFVECTLNHKFMLKNYIYLEAQNLIPGDMLMSLYTRTINYEIESIQFINKREDVYDIEVEDNHNFALDCGVFVHNSKDQVDAIAGALYSASQHAEEYAFDYGESAELMLQGNKSTTTESNQQQLQVAFEEELMKMFNPMANQIQQQNKGQNEEDTKDNKIENKEQENNAKFKSEKQSEKPKEKSPYMDFGLGPAKVLPGSQYINNGIMFW